MFQILQLAVIQNKPTVHSERAKLKTCDLTLKGVFM